VVLSVWKKNCPIAVLKSPASAVDFAGVIFGANPDLFYKSGFCY
jgi:hypothetical protein